ncbi:hypothetical protein GCM10027186_57440 [Micromonospora schwarzwaldensis]
MCGTTVNRYCSSSLETIRMALHAIRAGEDHAFVSAGVECVSRYDRGRSDGHPGSANPRFADAVTRPADRPAGGGAPLARLPRPGRRGYGAGRTGRG